LAVNSWDALGGAFNTAPRTDPNVLASALNEKGRVRFVMANSAADARGTELEVHKALIETSTVSCLSRAEFLPNLSCTIPTAALSSLGASSPPAGPPQYCAGARLLRPHIPSLTARLRAFAREAARPAHAEGDIGGTQPTTAITRPDAAVGVVGCPRLKWHVSSPLS
jgi:hypothetical protein